MPLSNQKTNHIQQQNNTLQKVKTQYVQPIPSEQNSLSEDVSVDLSQKQINEGRWNQEQNFKFVIFVHYYQDVFSSKHKRKVSKIFRTFTQYLTERTAAQCRSHYQKMIMKHKTVPKLKKYYKQYFGEERYRQEYDIFKQNWEYSHSRPLKTSTDLKQARQFGTQTQKQEKYDLLPKYEMPIQPLQPIPSIENNYYYLYCYNLQANPQISNPLQYYWIMPNNDFSLF